MRCPPIALLVVLATAAACNGDEAPVGKAPAKVAEAKTPPTPTPDPTPPKPVPEDPFADDKWDEPDDDADTADTGDAPPPPVATPTGPWPGPCKVTYKGGPTLRFKYTDAGGTVRVDSDNDGNADTCGKLERKDGHTTRISIDLDCDKKTDLRMEPKRTGTSNVIAAKVTATEDNGGNREITLVDLGIFSGLEPGFVLSAPLADVESKVDAKGKVTKASIKGDGGTKLAMAYDKEGRVKSLDEDVGGDGTVDRKFAYKYDAKGNLTKIDVTVTTIEGEKPTKKKQSATLDYSCWK